jgi:hypothetical protein
MGVDSDDRWVVAGSLGAATLRLLGGGTGVLAGPCLCQGTSP